MSEQTATTEQKNVWYYRPPTQQVVGVEGPLTGVQLLQRAKEGKIGLNTLVRNPVATKNQWVPAERIPSLATAIGEAKNSPAAAAPLAKAPGKPRVPPVPAPALAAPSQAVEVVEEVAEVEEVAVVEVPPLPMQVAVSEPLNPFAQLRSPTAVAPAAETNPFSPPAYGSSDLQRSGESSKDRYPNLHRYLYAIRSIAFIIMILAMIIGAGFVIGAIILQLVQLNFGVLFTGFFTGLLIAGIGYVYYMLALAGTEMMQVIIDIEANTRTRRD